AMVGICRQVDGAFTDEAVREDLRLVRPAVAGETHDRHVVALRKIGSSMERDERRAPVFPRELIAFVEKKPVGSEVRGKGDERIFGVSTAADDLSIPAIL